MRSIVREGCRCASSAQCSASSFGRRLGASCWCPKRDLAGGVAQIPMNPAFTPASELLGGLPANESRLYPRLRAARCAGRLPRLTLPQISRGFEDAWAKGVRRVCAIYLDSRRSPRATAARRRPAGQQTLGLAVGCSQSAASPPTSPPSIFRRGHSRFLVECVKGARHRQRYRRRRQHRQLYRRRRQ